MSYSDVSMPFESGEGPLLRQSRFWMLQLAGWLLTTMLYFRENIDGGFYDGNGPLTIAGTALCCAMAIACSSALAAAYLRMPPQWLTPVRALPIVLGLSLLAAVPWATVMTLLVVGAGLTWLGWREYGLWMLFHASVLMAAWSSVFLYLRRGERAPTPRSQTWALRAEAFAVEPSDPEQLETLPRDASQGSPTGATVIPWRPDDRVRLQEGNSVKLCLVRDIAYVRAAGDYAEIHLCDGQVALVRQRLLYWESRLPESFIRIHRSTVINLELSEELVHDAGAWGVRLRGCPEPLAVSRRLVQAVKAKKDGRATE